MITESFKPLEITDRTSLEPFFKKYPHSLSGYSFSGLISWSQAYKYSWRFLCDNLLLIRSNYEKNEQEAVFFQPIGDLGGCREVFEKEILKHFSSISFFAVDKIFIDKNKDIFKGFEIENSRDYADYIYLADDLASLPGRKYSKKKNLISQANASYSYEYRKYDPGDYAGCMSLLESDNETTGSGSLKLERSALDYALKNFEKLSFGGGVVVSSNKIIAFSIFEEQDPLTVVVHFEKGNKEHKGIYQIINQETSKYISSLGYKYINREYDLGVLGLRQAKESYFPIELRDSFFITRL
jgi:hypothetical protein